MFGDIRAIEKDGEPWFVGKDVAVALGYCKSENALAAHVDQEHKTITLIQGSGSNYKSNTTLINESGLYSLVFSSKLPQAKVFKHWVTAEVLPSIHRHGGYATAPTIEKIIASTEFGIALLRNLWQEQLPDAAEMPSAAGIRQTVMAQRCTFMLLQTQRGSNRQKNVSTRQRQSMTTT